MTSPVRTPLMPSTTVTLADVALPLPGKVATSPTKIIGLLRFAQSGVGPMHTQASAADQTPASNSIAAEDAV